MAIVEIESINILCASIERRALPMETKPYKAANRWYVSSVTLVLLMPNW